MPSTLPQIVFRPQQEFADKLRKAAKENQRTLSQEIIYRLLKSFKGEK